MFRGSTVGSSNPFHMPCSYDLIMKMGFMVKEGWVGRLGGNRDIPGRVVLRLVKPAGCSRLMTVSTSVSDVRCIFFTFHSQIPQNKK